jgi:signal transduction histidine kinase
MGLLALAFVLTFATPIPPGEVAVVVLFPIFLIGFASVGALIAAKQPSNPIGWIFLAVAMVFAVAALTNSYALYVAQEGLAVSAAARVADWLGSWLITPALFVSATFPFLLFPNGRLPSSRWRFLAWGVGIAIGALTVGSALQPGPLQDARFLRSNPYAIGSAAFWEVVTTIGAIVVIVGLVGSALAVVARLRRSKGEERQQVKWLAYAGVVVAATILLTLVVQAIWGNNRNVEIVAQALILGTVLLVPVAAGVAILRYRLYDIDVVINRTVVYGLLAAFVTLIYVAIVVGIGALIGSRGNVLLSIVATALIALAFQPMRERARLLANRLVYGKRATPYEVMSEFADRVAGTYSLDDVLPRMARIAAEGTGAEGVEVWVRVGNELRLEASWPAGGDSRSLRLTANAELPSIPDVDRAVPVTQQSEVLGAIAVTMPRTEALTSAGEKLLADLASQAGLVLRNVRLIEELRASRQRLVAAQDEERRRLERNLHDGAQQQLVALSVKMRLLKVLARKDPEKTDELVDQLQADSQDALDNLRDLARGIYPPLLADRGLAAALEAQARKAAIPVEVEPDGIARYDQEAEATAYFCVLEAIQNVAKYADASRVIVHLAEEEGHLTFTVTDDGQGFDVEATPKGSGLQNMADRVDAVGGTLVVDSVPQRGTRVAGRIPVRRSPGGEGPVPQQPQSGEEDPDREQAQQRDENRDQRLHVEDPAR